MKKGRKKDHVWEFVKYKGDCAIYAKCSCGFRYGCDKRENRNGFKNVPAPERLYNYCPVCGSRKLRYIPEVRKINEFPWHIGVKKDE